MGGPVLIFIPVIKNVRRGGEIGHSPLILLQLHTRITVHAQTAAQQQSNGSYEARMSGKCGEWRD